MLGVPAVRHARMPSCLTRSSLSLLDRTRLTCRPCRYEDDEEDDDEDASEGGEEDDEEGGEAAADEDEEAAENGVAGKSCSSQGITSPITIPNGCFARRCIRM